MIRSKNPLSLSDPTKPVMQHANSLERPFQPISSSMNHMTPRENNHVAQDNNHVSQHHPEMELNSMPDSGAVARETGLVSHDDRVQRMSGMQRTDSLDTAGSQISELCYSLSQLTKGAPG